MSYKLKQRSNVQRKYHSDRSYQFQNMFITITTPLVLFTTHHFIKLDLHSFLLISEEHQLISQFHQFSAFHLFNITRPSIIGIKKKILHSTNSTLNQQCRVNGEQNQMDNISLQKTMFNAAQWDFSLVKVKVLCHSKSHPAVHIQNLKTCSCSKIEQVGGTGELQICNQICYL